MALKDLFRRRSGTQAAPTGHGDPGGVSSQLDGDDSGTVSLDDRTKPGGQGSPDTNQGTTEPMPATPGQPDPNAPLEPPSLGDMNVGGADPQSPSHPGTRERDEPVLTSPVLRVEPGVAPQDDRPGIDPASSNKLPEGPERPDQASEGTARRAPGSMGVSPEQQETDVDSGAANMRPGGGPQAVPPTSMPGDAKEVPVPHDVPAEGTSETAPIAQGIRSPEQPDA